MLPDGLLSEISELIKSGKAVGCTAVTDFVRDAVRKTIEEYERFKRKVEG